MVTIVGYIKKKKKSVRSLIFNIKVKQKSSEGIWPDKPFGANFLFEWIINAEWYETWEVVPVKRFNGPALVYYKIQHICQYLVLL